MKKIYALLAILTVPTLLLLNSYHTGSPGSYTGSPLDGQSCVSCHSSAAIEIDSWISSDIPSEGFTAGETYTITMYATDQNAVRFGFQITAEGDDSKTGSYTVTDVTRTKIGNDNNSITHTANGIDPIGHEITWEFEWTAPDPAPTTVTFYAAVNAANGNGQNTGDQIYLTSQSYNQFFVGLADLSLQEQVSVYPNPATSFVKVNAPANAEMRVVDITGKIVLERINTAANETFNLSNLSDGMYFVQVMQNSEMATIKLLKN